MFIFDKKINRFPKHLENYSDSLKEYEEKKEKNSEEFDHEFVPVDDKLDVDVLNNGLLNVSGYVFGNIYRFSKGYTKISTRNT